MHLVFQNSANDALDQPQTDDPRGKRDIAQTGGLGIYIGIIDKGRDVFQPWWR